MPGTDHPMRRPPTPAQAERLAHVHLEANPGGVPVAQTAKRLADGIADILSAKAAIVRRRRGRWAVAAESTHEPALLLQGDTNRLLDELSGPGAPPHGVTWTGGGQTWTLVSSGRRPRVAVAVHGVWQASNPSLLVMAENASVALAAAATADRARAVTAVHRMTRRLVHAHTPRAVWDLNVKSMADSVEARLGALAVPGLTDPRLRIVTTYGYPIELVEHLRIEPGTGVLGSVFESGRLLHVQQATQVPSRRPRPRYRTGSFVAIPIGFSRAPLGVVCVADRRDNQPFTREDVSRLRALAAPAALALDRERATSRADRYARAATVDPLSGAFNRRYFQARLEEELERSRRQHSAVALIMLDLDDFKRINDSYGHLGGDTVIRDIAEILRRSVRVFDVCARFGGEEFAVLMPNTTVESAAKIATRIRQRIESYRPVEPGLGHLQVTASIGLAMSTPTLGGRDLLERADSALYQAKREGKNRLRIRGSAPELSDAPGQP